jgi:DNA (cytosine-5)-methyltransferase 1
MTIKVLNLYACLGGNRLHWNHVYNNIEVTAVENDKELAKLYKERFVNDTVIIADAHEYLLNNYKNFDFIWSSPPCPSHSRAAHGARKSENSNHKPIYPDLKLYEEIIFLENYFKGKYCVENVIPYYTPLIPAQKRHRHLYWSNFKIPTVLSKRTAPNMENAGALNEWCKFHQFDFFKYQGKQRKDKIARNLVDFEAGRTIFETFININQKKTEQIGLFNF